MKNYRVVLSAAGVSQYKEQTSKKWTVSVHYIAYREISSSLVKSSGYVVFENCSKKQAAKLQKEINPYRVIHIAAEMNNGFLKTEKLLESNATPLEDEAEFLSQYALPETLTDSQLGVFTLNKEFGYSEAWVELQGREISVLIYSKKDIEALRLICADQDIFIENAKRYAAVKLLELGNQWQMDNADSSEDYVPLTEDDFVNRMKLKEISLENINGVSEYTLCFDDGDIFWGHSIVVFGDMESGFTDAEMQ